MNKYFYKYVNGNKWIQINGIGNDPKNCKISWEASKDNEDMFIIETAKIARSPLYDWIKFDDPKYINNIYAQVLKINLLIREGYMCEKYDVPHIEPLLPDPQIIIPEKEEMEEKISINKSELSKINSIPNEFQYLMSPKFHDKKKRQKDMQKWLEDQQDHLEVELKNLYPEL